MLIRVAFGDNDYSLYVKDACEAVLAEISCGHEGIELVERFKKHIDEYGTGDIRKRIVLSATGFCMARNGARGRFTGLFSGDEVDLAATLTLYDNAFHYLGRRVLVEVVQQYNKDDDNAETCYIDLFKNAVVLC